MGTGAGAAANLKADQRAHRMAAAPPHPPRPRSVRTPRLQLLCRPECKDAQRIRAAAGGAEACTGAPLSVQLVRVPQPTHAVLPRLATEARGARGALAPAHMRALLRKGPRTWTKHLQPPSTTRPPRLMAPPQTHHTLRNLPRTPQHTPRTRSSRSAWTRASSASWRTTGRWRRSCGCTCRCVPHTG